MNFLRNCSTMMSFVLLTTICGFLLLVAVEIGGNGFVPAKSPYVSYERQFDSSDYVGGVLPEIVLQSGLYKIDLVHKGSYATVNANLLQGLIHCGYVAPIIAFSKQEESAVWNIYNTCNITIEVNADSNWALSIKRTS